MNRITFSCILLLSLINIVQCKKYLVEVEDKKGDNAKENEESMRHSINALEAVEAELGIDQNYTLNIIDALYFTLYYLCQGNTIIYQVTKRIPLRKERIPLRETTTKSVELHLFSRKDPAFMV